ncbi:MAG: hypothetical protein EOP51_31105, partial [Sphingobacteriales bacterium]
MKRKQLFLGLSMLAYGLSSCQKSEVKSTETATNRLKTVATVSAEGTWTGFFKRNSNNGWSAGDATLSIPVTHNHTTNITGNFWLFGDSHINDISYNGSIYTRNCMYSVYNGMMYQNSNTANVFTTLLGTGSGPAQTRIKFPENSGPLLYFPGVDTIRLWPGHGYEEGNFVYAFYSGHRNNMSYKQGYTYVATMLYTGTGVSATTVTKLASTKTSNGINWGMWCIASTTDNYVYIYGTKGGGYLGSSYLHVARATKTNINGAWDYWNGTTFQSNVNNSVSVCSGISNHASVVKFLNSSGQARYAVINQEIPLGCGNGRNINLYGISTALTGPFNFNKTLYTVVDKLPGHTGPSDPYMRTYDCQAHPQIG